MDRASRVHTSVIAKNMEFDNICHATMGAPWVMLLSKTGTILIN